MNKIEAALRLYEEAREDIFAQCLSNPIQNAWGKQVNVLKLNQAHEAARAALRDAKASAATLGEYPELTQGAEACEFISGAIVYDADQMRAYYDLGRAQAFAPVVDTETIKKAARYDWLRDQDWNDSDLCVVANPRQAVRLGHDCPSRDRLDAFIDAAIEAQAKKGGE